MNGEIKKHIDAARQVLVGVVPNPSSQIDQITYALIYKFMDDMDQAAIKSGDKPSFFIDDLEEYSWARLMDSKLGNQEKMNLYVLAFQKFAEAKQLPELFRNILKSAFLPYRSPETLGLFLKEINYFDYSHPEELGNAYEYLLSIMSSQGDAGQFRTPRHIIDFIVDVVNPTKNDKILDPACGTGGFLISSYKHILEQHDGKDDPEGKKKPLTPDERRKLMSNLEGYDIDPGMVRIAQVNMYLHQFKNPKIFQYDTLSNEERWKDHFDVILANPPFMSPKGGITPHKKFSVSSNRSEVLFVDYIMNHLRPKGRAGIIVPEGVIFQSGRAYKELRKNLVNDGLCAVVSLPSGVFNPYSGVKTSILFFDNEIAKKTKEILFIKINQDGFNLGAQRRPIEKNDLPKALEILKKWKVGEKIENDLASYVNKSKIAENDDYNLSSDRYRLITDNVNVKWTMVELEDVIEFEKKSRRKSGDGKENGLYKFFVSSQVQNKFIDEVDYVNENLILGTGGNASVHISCNFSTSADTFVFHSKDNRLSNRYLYYCLINNKEVLENGFRGQGIKHLSKEYLLKIKIPLPSFEIQEKIVKELDGYQSIIMGAKQIIDNWKPRIDIDPGWKKVKIGEIFRIESGGTPDSTERKYWNGEIKWATLADIPHNIEIISDTKRKITSEGLKASSAKLFPKGTVMVSSRATIGRIAIAGAEMSTNQGFKNIIIDNKNEPLFIAYSLNEKIEEMIALANGGTFKEISKTCFSNLEIYLPPLDIQKKVIENIEEEYRLLESSKKMISIYEEKIKKVIDKLWNKYDN